MSILNLPREIALPVVVGEQLMSKVMLDLTAYLVGPSEQELDYLIDLYEKICPPDRRARYIIAELPYWADVERPVLTMSARAAAAAGIRRPYLEPERQRIREGRAIKVGIWDGRSIRDTDGSWSFSCRSIHRRSTGLHAAVRILIPLGADYEILRNAARAIADNVELYSGHGGLTFTYDPWFKEGALNAIYVQARRFWGVDIDDMSDTLPLTKNAIKGVNWITVLGPRLTPEDSAAKIEAALSDIANIPDVTFEQRQHATVLTLGVHPVAGDQHRPDHSLDPYYNVAGALRPLYLEEHPDFPGERFVKNGNTIGWIRRFIDPNGWR